jgi:hypothetical protein
VINAIKDKSGADYARLAARLKEETKVRIAPFEAALRAAKGNGADSGDDNMPGKPLTFDTIEPWPDPVDGAEWTCPAFVESVFDFTLPALRTEAG